MPIGTSKGAFHEDEFRMEASPWFIDPKMEDSDNNIIDPDIDPGSTVPLNNPIVPVKYLGVLGPNDDLSWDRTEAIGRRNSEGKVEYHTDPEELSKKKLLPDEESYTMPDNPHLWIRKKDKSPKPNLSDLIS